MPSTTESNTAKDKGKSGDKKESETEKKGGSLGWLHEAANYVSKDEKKPPKSTGDWMKDGGKIV